MQRQVYRTYASVGRIAGPKKKRFLLGGGSREHVLSEADREREILECQARHVPWGVIRKYAE